MRLVLAALMLTGAFLPALAHDHGPGSWINTQRLTDPLSGLWCCNHNDCAVVATGGVSEVTGGYRIADTQEIIPHERVIWKSPDGAWWRCRFLAGANAGKTRCLIGSPPGS